jgi:hypothetical protein
MRVHHQVRGAADVYIREHFVYPEGLNTQGELNYTRTLPREPAPRLSGVINGLEAHRRSGGEEARRSPENPH